jgi:uncharacterized protein YciI
MMKKALFVAINLVAAPASAIEPFVAEHLSYIKAVEAKGELWASGPFIDEGVLVGDSLMILSIGKTKASKTLGAQCAGSVRNMVGPSDAVETRADRRRVEASEIPENPRSSSLWLRRPGHQVDEKPFEASMIDFEQYVHQSGRRWRP